MSTFFPVYRIASHNKVIVKFIDHDTGYVLDPGNSNYKVGSLHTDWAHYNESCWAPYDYANSDTPTKTPDQLELFETTSIKISSLKDTSITRVPNGYVMTSSSGHQLFIKDLSKDSL